MASVWFMIAIAVLIVVCAAVLTQVPQLLL